LILVGCFLGSEEASENQCDRDSRNPALRMRSLFFCRLLGVELEYKRRLPPALYRKLLWRLGHKLIFYHFGCSDRHREALRVQTLRLHRDTERLRVSIFVRTT